MMRTQSVTEEYSREGLRTVLCWRSLRWHCASFAVIHRSLRPIRNRRRGRAAKECAETGCTERKRRGRGGEATFAAARLNRRSSSRGARMRRVATLKANAGSAHSGMPRCTGTGTRGHYRPAAGAGEGLRRVPRSNGRRRYGRGERCQDDLGCGDVYTPTNKRARQRAAESLIY